MNNTSLQPLMRHFGISTRHYGISTVVHYGLFTSRHYDLYTVQYYSTSTSDITTYLHYVIIAHSLFICYELQLCNYDILPISSNRSVRTLRLHNLLSPFFYRALWLIYLLAFCICRFRHDFAGPGVDTTELIDILIAHGSQLF